MKEYCWRIHQGDKKAAYRELQSRHPSPRASQERRREHRWDIGSCRAATPPQGRPQGSPHHTPPHPPLQRYGGNSQAISERNNRWLLKNECKSQLTTGLLDFFLMG